MGSFESLTKALQEGEIAKRVGNTHDEARMCFVCRSNTVRDFDEFSDLIGQYYVHHYATCVARGAQIDRVEAIGRAKEILEQAYRRHQGNLMTAYRDASEGTNSGLRGVLDRIADALKAESVERYVREAFDAHVKPTEWNEKVSIIRQLFQTCGQFLPSYIRTDQPEKYASDYQELVRGYTEALRRTTNLFSRH